MQDYRKYYPHMLSGGQQQRIALARTLAYNPKIMLLDEPFANLDVVLRKNIRNESFAILKQLRTPVLMVTHDPEEAISIADKIYVMQDGKFIQSGTPKELYDNPINLFVAEFFGEINIIDVGIENGWAHTPIGYFDASLHNVGQRALVCIRQEDIKIVSKSDIKAEVFDIKFLGLTTKVYLKIAKLDKILKMRILSNQLPKIGEEVAIKINNSLIFNNNQ